MIIKFCLLSMSLACIVSGCASFPELEEAAPLNERTAELTKFLSSDALKSILTSFNRVAQPFNASQLDNLRRRADNLRTQNSTSN